MLAAFYGRYEFALPGFGIKAKPDDWATAVPLEFALPGFGIKAKPDDWATAVPLEFALPGFGIKAKQDECNCGASNFWNAARIPKIQGASSSL